MNNNLFADRLHRALIDNSLMLPKSVEQQLIDFLLLLWQWNTVYNLTAIRDEKAAVYLHIIDSLLVSPYVTGQHCLDVGTGAGLPGLPLAILHPEQQWTLLDKVSKKTRFLIQVVAQLGLKNVTVVQANAGSFQFKTGFDSILSRAFGTLEKLIDETAHLLQPQGQWIAMKGQYPAYELQTLPSSISYEVHPLTMVGMEVERHVICYKKI